MEKSGKVFVKGTFVNHPKLVVAKDCPRTETWFPDDWAKALKGADFGTPAGTVVKRFTKIVRQDKSVVVYSTSWRGTVEVFHQGNPECITLFAAILMSGSIWLTVNLPVRQEGG